MHGSTVVFNIHLFIAEYTLERVHESLPPPSLSSLSLSLSRC